MQRQKVELQIIEFKCSLLFLLDLDESYISLSKINHVSSSTNSSKESPGKDADNEGQKNDNLTFTKKEKSDEDSHIKQSRENQELKQVQFKKLELQFSICFFLQAIEEQKRRFELQEKAINALKHEYESKIERLKKEHNSRIEEGMICIHRFNK